MKKYLLVFIIGLLGSNLAGQNLKIGVRAGLNYFKTLGELEPQEKQSLSSGFHFGINGTYYFNDVFGVRTEILYTQKGSLLENEGELYSLFDLPTGERVFELGQGKYSLRRTFNTFSVPLQVAVKPIKKIELFAGVNFDFIAGSIGQGNFEFDNMNNDEPIFFIQTLNFNYNTDAFSDTNINSRGFLTVNYDVNGDGILDELVFANSIGAYRYFDEEIDSNLIKSFDLGVNAGLSYYINPGLYVRGTFNYGLRDITRGKYDYSLEEINDDGSYIFRDDTDRKIGFQVSLGFQF